MDEKPDFDHLYTRYTEQREAFERAYLCPVESHKLKPRNSQLHLLCLITVSVSVGIIFLCTLLHRALLTPIPRPFSKSAAENVDKSGGFTRREMVSGIGPHEGYSSPWTPYRGEGGGGGGGALIYLYKQELHNGQGRGITTTDHH
jgi:hypothetical protein